MTGESCIETAQSKHDSAKLHHHNNYAHGLATNAI